MLDSCYSAFSAWTASDQDLQLSTTTINRSEKCSNTRVEPDAVYTIQALEFQWPPVVNDLMSEQSFELSI